MQSVIHTADRLVIKVGSSLVTNDGRGLDHGALARWAGEIAELKRRGKQVLLVSSGAIAEGCQRLGWAKRPKAVHELQAAAAVGQMGLCEAYEHAFGEHGIRTAQVLLTHEDLADRTRYLNARTTLVTAEIRFGDNDTLGALVTNLIEADALLILTDQQGLYTADPRKHPDARFVHEAEAGDAALEEMAGGAGSSVGTGGMLTKVLAARRAARSGASTVIACGREAQVLSRLADGEAIGTQLTAPTTRMAARKQWMADHLQLAGTLTVDEGAARALRERGTSLLPVGVTRVDGRFLRGDVVACVDEHGTEVARGLANYGSEEARLIMRRPTRDIEGILGYLVEPELIHRDNMVSL